MQHLVDFRKNQVGDETRRAADGRWVFDGVSYPTRGEMRRTRRERYVASLNARLNFTQADRAVDVSKCTGKVWRNEHTRATGRNEKPSVDWYRSPVNKPTKLHNATSTRPNAF